MNRFQKEIEVARRAAAESAELAASYKSRGITAEAKGDLSPVTIADRECEKLISRIMREAFPDDGLLGEEGASVAGASGRRWIIDPIDGTRDYVRGNLQWAVLIGLEEAGEVVAGVCNLPGYREMYWAVKGGGAWVNETPIKASPITSVSEAVCCINGINALVRTPYGNRILLWLEPFWAVRSFGGAPDAMLLCSGKADVWIEPKAAPWDLAPMKILAEESGVRFRNLDGGSSIYGGDCLMYVPALEPAVNQLLGQS